MTVDTIESLHAMDRAFAGALCHAVDQDGVARPLDVPMWQSEASAVDRELFIRPCTGTTLDIGCGPGRLAAALNGRSLLALGIDVSGEAIRQARDRGATAIRRDVFSYVPAEGCWDHAILADDNLGIGGDPVRLLKRVRELVRSGGNVIVEVEAEEIGLIQEMVRLHFEDRVSEPFAWARVGRDAIMEVAADAGMEVVDMRQVGGRHSATLRSTDV